MNDVSDCINLDTLTPDQVLSCFRVAIGLARKRVTGDPSEALTAIDAASEFLTQCGNTIGPNERHALVTELAELHSRALGAAEASGERATPPRWMHPPANLPVIDAATIEGVMPVAAEVLIAALERNLGGWLQNASKTLERLSPFKEFQSQIAPIQSAIEAAETAHGFLLSRPSQR